MGLAALLGFIDQIFNILINPSSINEVIQAVWNRFM